jgi:signal transduction histidine kinase
LNELKAYEVTGHVPIRTEDTNIVEFDDLNKTVSHLTERSRKVFLQQKEFIENASHELQTPLAIFQSKLDVLMQNVTLNEQNASVILELEDTAQRMSRLNKSLLLLSQIDNEQFTSKESVDAALVMNTILNNLRPFADAEGIRIATSFQPLDLHVNKTLLEVLFTNLLSNAIRHTEKGGTIEIKLAERRMTISNTGVPLKSDAEKLFERFYKESKDHRSTGLGLAIVKRFVTSAGLRLRIDIKKTSMSSL